MAKKYEDLRAKLSGGGKSSGRKLDVWLDQNADALALVDQWLAMRASGECFWSAGDIVSDLRASYGMPPFGVDALRGWIARHRKEQWT